MIAWLILCACFALNTGSLSGAAIVAALGAGLAVFLD